MAGWPVTHLSVLHPLSFLSMLLLCIALPPSSSLPSIPTTVPLRFVSPTLLHAHLCISNRYVSRVCEGSLRGAFRDDGRDGSDDHASPRPQELDPEQDEGQGGPAAAGGRDCGAGGCKCVWWGGVNPVACFSLSATPTPAQLLVVHIPVSLLTPPPSLLESLHIACTCLHTLGLPAFPLHEAWHAQAPPGMPKPPWHAPVLGAWGCPPPPPRHPT